MTLAMPEFIRRFLMHVLPRRLHRIRHYGLFANGNRAENIAQARVLLNVAKPPDKPNAPETADGSETHVLQRPCPCCGGRMLIIEIFERGSAPRYRPSAPVAAIRIDTS